MPPAPALDRLLTVSARYFGLPPETVSMLVAHGGADRPAAAARRQTDDRHPLTAMGERNPHAARK